MTDKEAMRLALDALESTSTHPQNSYQLERENKAIASLREALDAEQAEQSVTAPDVCGEVCERAKLCYGCGKNLDKANAEYEQKYGCLSGTEDWTPPNYTDEQWQMLDKEYRDHLVNQTFDWEAMSAKQRKATRAKKITNPGVYEYYVGEFAEPTPSVPIGTVLMPQREWVEPTMFQIDDACAGTQSFGEVARAVLKLSKELNHG